MSSLIQIRYGLDSSGNVLSLTLNPNSIGSYRSEINKFFIYLEAVNTDVVPIPTAENFQTQLEFYASTGSQGYTGAGVFMESSFVNAVDSSQFLYTLDFQSAGYNFTQSLVGA